MMKRILTVLIIATSTLFGDAACNLIEPKFDAIAINSPSLLSSLKKLEEKAQAIYKPYGEEVAFRIFDLSKNEKNSIEYSAKNVSLSEAATAILKQSKEKFYLTQSGVIWIGVSKETVEEISANYPERLEAVNLPMVVFKDKDIAEVEEIMGKLFQIYNPWQNSNSFAWSMNTGRSFDGKINLKCRHIDFLSLVTYLDIVTKYIQPVDADNPGNPPLNSKKSTGRLSL